jgi:hypothetical protein
LPGAKIYTGSNLKPYQIAVNSAAQSLAKDNPTLLQHRGTLYVYRLIFEMQNRTLNVFVSKLNVFKNYLDCLGWS